MKIYYRKMKRVGPIRGSNSNAADASNGAGRKSQECRLKPTGPWRLALGGSPFSLDLAQSQEGKVVFLLPIDKVLPADKNNSELLLEE